ncbi:MULTISPECIES: EamA family transporter [Sphingomonas]|uniref:EamA family transporter n=1 Tax=Sphingomonas TaxID=13687 RepID=UPI0006F59A95|nr:EamA family transporter [Sphingomonas sp. Leaf226]KQM96309.1 hypothetical protein ASE77_19030 [Sphingomonas sp. Leaf226]
MIDGNDVLALTVWSCLFATPPLGLLALLVEGRAMIADAMAVARPAAWLVVLWQAYGNTLFGYGLWAWLLTLHPAATVTLLALLVPVFGMCSAPIILSEPLPAWKLVGAGLALAGFVVMWRDRAGPARHSAKPFSARP